MHGMYFLPLTVVYRATMALAMNPVDVLRGLTPLTADEVLLVATLALRSTFTVTLLRTR